MSRNFHCFFRVLNFLRLAVAASTLFLFTGCRAILGEDDSERPSDLPWSEPAGWESQGMGLPY